MLNLRNFVSQVSLEEAGAGSQREGHGLWSQETWAQQQGTMSTTCVTLGRKSHLTEPQTPYLKNKTMINYTHKCTHMYYVHPTVRPSECWVSFFSHLLQPACPSQLPVYVSLFPQSSLSMFPTLVPTLPAYFSSLLLSRSPNPSPPPAHSTLTLKLVFFSPCCQPFCHEPSCLYPASPSVSSSFRSDSGWKQLSSLHSPLQTQSSR